MSEWVWNASHPERDLINFHFGWGMSIRNELGLWQGNKELLRSCGSKKMHPDDASMVIIKAVRRKRQNMNNPDDVQKLFRGAF